MRYLPKSDIRWALEQGRLVDQIISPSSINGAVVLRWIELRPIGDQITIVLHEVFDQGSQNDLNLYSFERVAPDDEPVQHSFSTLEKAMVFAETTYAARPDRYVNQGVIQDEYADYLLNGRTANRQVHERRTCDECGSLYYADTSRMDRLCPECASILYGYDPCIHEFVDGRCRQCHWDGSVSEYCRMLKGQGA